ncbi:MAG: pilus assembly protein PilP [Deltaproteobacteria bacterium]|nr:pilus assembly protein PilP [Deltaproteobacteria bacterium]
MDREGRSKGVLTFILVIGIALTVGGCDNLPLPFGKKRGKKEEQNKIVVTPKRLPRVPPPTSSPSPLPPKEEKRHYVYNPTGKRDPFRPFIAMQTPIKPSGEQVPITPLQKYDLSQVKLVAILVGKKGGRAMVEDSEGKGYIIKKGTYIGRNYGTVKAILKDRVIIEEKYKDYLGNVKLKRVVLRLHVPGEEKRP